MNDKEVEKFKRELLRNETALTPVQAAEIIGCRPRDLNEFIKPSFRVNGRPKYIVREVIKIRDRMVQAASESGRRNTQMIRTAAA